MPTYEYRCTQCKHTMEEFQSMKDEALTQCPSCQTPNLVRIIGNGSGFIFKGSGFYLTDYKKVSSQSSISGTAKPKEEQTKNDSSSADGQKSGNEQRSGSSGNDGQKSGNEQRTGNSGNDGQKSGNEQRTGNSGNDGQKSRNEQRTGNSDNDGQKSRNEQRTGSSGNDGAKTSGTESSTKKSEPAHNSSERKE